jgi:hypothetical protein
MQRLKSRRSDVMHDRSDMTMANELTTTEKAHYFDVITKIYGIDFADKEKAQREGYAKLMGKKLRQHVDLMETVDKYGDELGFRPSSDNRENIVCLLKQLIKQGITLEEPEGCPT